MKCEHSKKCNIILGNCSGTQFIQFSNLKKCEKFVSHCFSTRIGGVSSGECSSLNLGLNKNDSRENVVENFNRICNAIGADSANTVLSNQVHGTVIQSVSEEDRGQGLFRSNDNIECDGLMTDKSKVLLTTFYADCVPLLFYDTKRQVIAASHSGWRGTAKNIAGGTVEKMIDEYGSQPENVIAAIGPSICKCCFEVGEEVYESFTDTIKWSVDFCHKNSHGKWMIDLQGIIKRQLILSWVPDRNICDGSICTRCNTDYFYSYRGENGKTGSLAALIQLNSNF